MNSQENLIVPGLHVHRHPTRREFTTLLGCAAVAWPVVVRAQPPKRMRLIGRLVGALESDTNAQRRFAAFKEGMQQLGWIEGHNVRYETRWGAGNRDRISAYAKELVQMAPDVLFTNGTPSTAALHQYTKTIPIVFAIVSDPVGDGFVASLSHPGGNVTGFITFYPEMVGKWLEMLKKIAPHIKRTALMFNPRTAPFSRSDFLRPLFEQTARHFAIEPIMSPVHDVAEIETAIDSLARTPGGSLLIMPDGFPLAHRALIIERTASHRLPAMYPFGLFTSSGGLIAYGVDLVDLNRRAASYVDRILKGAKASDLPVQAPTAFELSINLKTARNIGLTVPPSLLLQANKVIE
jgi:putative ABC transport system substrate-binding protein